jgi:hypothetical protein
MNARYLVSVACKLIAAGAFCMTAATAVEAAPIKLDAVISPTSESKLEFADGSKRLLVATQREGTVNGDGPFAGARMLEWGVHDVIPGNGAHGNGYVVLTTGEGDVAYLKYQFRALQIPVANGKRRVLINGNWELVGGTGKFKDQRGGGTLHVKRLSPKERHWFLEGELL